jgi:transcription elongation factor Elf1
MIRRKDLTDIGDSDYKSRQGEFVLCTNCGHQFGGTRDDYFLMELDDIFTCSGCGESKYLVLAVKRVKIEICRRWL